MQAKLTNQAIKALAATGAEYVCWDTVLKRFGVKVTKLGTKSFIVQYRTGGRGSPTRRVTIGEPGDASWTVEKARKEAGIILGKVDAGVDPFAERQAVKEAERLAREEEEASKRRGFSDVVEQYNRDRLSRQARGAVVYQLLKREFVSEWGDRDIATITSADVKSVLFKMKDAGLAGAAMEALKRIRPLFQFAISGTKDQLISINPASKIDLGESYVPRVRHLNDAELREVWMAAETLGYPFGAMVKLLILTGQRLREVGSAEWREINEDRTIWTIPASRSKNRKPHVVHLSPQVRTVLDTLPRMEAREENGNSRPSPYIFTTTGIAPVSGFSKAKTHIDKAISKAREKAANGAEFEGMPPWTFHDLRRTFATGGAVLEIPLHIIEKVLNHIPTALKGVAGIYQQHEFLNERRAALETWGAHVEALTNSHKK